MKFLFPFIGIFIISPLFGQHLFPEGQTACSSKSFLIENDAILAQYDSNEALLFDFLKKLETRNLKKIKGELLIQVMIDSIGYPCCISFKNQTNVETKRLGIVNAVNSMTGWKLSDHLKNKTNNCALIKFIFKDKKIIIMRLGYNEKFRFSVLSSIELKRNFERD